jgi:hypothetical protein
MHPSTSTKDDSGESHLNSSSKGHKGCKQIKISCMPSGIGSIVESPTNNYYQMKGQSSS